LRLRGIPVNGPKAAQATTTRAKGEAARLPPVPIDKATAKKKAP
jgi:hypothetical protein